MRRERRRFGDRSTTGTSGTRDSLPSLTGTSPSSTKHHHDDDDNVNTSSALIGGGLYRPYPGEMDLPMEFRVSSPVAGGMGGGDGEDERHHTPPPALASLPLTEESLKRHTAQNPAPPSHKEPGLLSDDGLPPGMAEIRCPVCLDPFSSPVTLSCNHNICEHHIADLAAAMGQCATVDHQFNVTCPKCREVTRFEGLKNVRVNHEMKALVGMLTTMLAAQKKQVQQQPSPAIDRKPSQRDGGGSSNGGDPVSARSKDSDGNSSHHTATYDVHATPLPSALRRHNSARKKGVEIVEPEGTNSRPQSGKSDRSSNNPGGQLTKLEQQIKNAREKTRKEREREMQAKQEAFKKQRLEEIEKRRQAMLHQAQAYSTAESTVAEAMLASPVQDEAHWQHVEAEFNRAKAAREASKEAERQRREAEVQQQVHKFLSKEERSRAEGSLRDSVKAKAAEEAIMYMYVPPEERPEPPREPTPEPPEVDVEVERRLWEVENRVMWEHEQELSRAQKAELAEQRALAMLGALKGKPKVLAKPSYKPKLNRQRPISRQ